MSISLETKLAILQQSEYEWPRYIKWLDDNQHAEITVEPKKWTFKLKLLRLLTFFLPLYWSLMLLKIPQECVIWTFVMSAKIKLRWLQAKGLKIVAIAGSYGKTSTKYIATHVLSGSKQVVMTPENINTPIGIARFILSSLNPTHEIFIAELGEYYPGDIAGLTRFLSPDYKILTPVGFAHLERFGSKAVLEKALNELISTQPKKGKAFIFGKDYAETDVSDVQISRAGTEFTYRGQIFFIPLFGKHNAVNTLPALWLATHIGVNETTVRERLASVPFIPHRLEPTQLEQNILILDNGYNANPGSSKETLEVLRRLDASERIVFTPGYIEMGEEQSQANEHLGEMIALVADRCVVINGVNTDAIVDGLRKGGLTKEKIFFANGEQEGMQMLTGTIKPSTIILFENSIPELYKKT